MGMFRFIIVLALCVGWSAAIGAQERRSDGSICRDTEQSDNARIEACTRVIDGGSVGKVRYLVARGATYRSKMLYSRAIEDFDRAIRIDPEYSWAYLNRGHTWRAMKHYDRAMRDYEKTIALDPDGPQGFNGRGRIHLIRGQFARAIEDFDQAIRRDNTYEAAFFNRGRAYYATQRFDQALASYDRAIALDKKYASAYADRGDVHRTMQRQDRATLDYYMAITLDSELTWPYRGLAISAYIEGDFARAAANLALYIEKTGVTGDNALLLFAARARAGQDGREDLARAAAILDRERWPAIAIRMFLGEATPDQVRSARATADLSQPVWEMESHFIVGLYALMHGDKVQAIQRFQWAMGSGLKQRIEHQCAAAELARLGVR